MVIPWSLVKCVNGLLYFKYQQILGLEQCRGWCYSWQNVHCEVEIFDKFNLLQIIQNCLGLSKLISWVRRWNYLFHIGKGSFEVLTHSFQCPRLGRYPSNSLYFWVHNHSRLVQDVAAHCGVLVKKNKIYKFSWLCLQNSDNQHLSLHQEHPTPVYVQRMA